MLHMTWLRGTCQWLGASQAVYGATIRGIFPSRDDPTTEELLDLRIGAKPSGTRLLEAWFSSNCTAVFPDSIFSAHVLQLNLYGLKREQELARYGVLVNPSRMRIVYESPARDKVEIVDVSQRWFHCLRVRL